MEAHRLHSASFSRAVASMRLRDCNRDFAAGAIANIVGWVGRSATTGFGERS